MLVWSLWLLIQWDGKDQSIPEYFFFSSFPHPITFTQFWFLEWNLFKGYEVLISFYCVVIGKNVWTSPKLPSSNGRYLWKCCTTLWGVKEGTRSGCSKLNISFSATLCSNFFFFFLVLNTLNSIFQKKNFGRLSLTGVLLLRLLLVNLKTRLYQFLPRYLLLQCISSLCWSIRLWLILLFNRLWTQKLVTRNLSPFPLMMEFDLMQHCLILGSSNLCSRKMDPLLLV